ncbi:MAG: hypothetical protein JXB32_01125 [Deltaproteobacteria bacterium]|nr:hypothetical protein [Deltaproteobacteria bacterium]
MQRLDVWLALASGLCALSAGLLLGRQARRRRAGIDLRNAMRLTRTPWIALIGLAVAAAGFAVLQLVPGLAWKVPHFVELHLLAFCGAAFLGPAGLLFGFAIGLAFASAAEHRWCLAALVAGLFGCVGVAWVVVTRPIADDLGHSVDPDGFILQTSGTSCAAASAANVARQLGLAVTEREMAERVGTTVLGTTSAAVVEGLSELGVTCRRIERFDTDPRMVVPPAILVVDHPATGPESHAVAFLGMDRGRALVVDPLDGLSRTPSERLGLRWHGHGLECGRP